MNGWKFVKGIPTCVNGWKRKHSWMHYSLKILTSMENKKWREICYQGNQQRFNCLQRKCFFIVKVVHWITFFSLTSMQNWRKLTARKLQHMNRQILCSGWTWLITWSMHNYKSLYLKKISKCSQTKVQNCPTSNFKWKNLHTIICKLQESLRWKSCCEKIFLKNTENVVSFQKNVLFKIIYHQQHSSHEENI